MNRSIFLKKLNKKNIIKKTNLNFGPQHPAAHGVLRMLLQLDGEFVVNTDTHIGLLHRGTEKLVESKNVIKSIPYFDRLDYVSMLMQEHSFCLAVEKLLQKNIYSNITSIVRIMYDELTRILNHLLALACHALDVGSMSAIFWGFEEREKIMEFYERVSGARMHAAFYRPNKLKKDGISNYLIKDINFFVKNSFTLINEINSLLIFNKIWKQRLVGVGIITPNDVNKYSLSGVLARSIGKKIDIRTNVSTTYSNYFFCDFKSYITQNGDCYDRYLIRIYEMLESLNIINQSCLKIKSKMFLFLNNFDLKNESYSTMESMINHFKYWSSGLTLKKNKIYSSIESSKGEFGVSLTTDNSNKLVRCKIRSSSFYNLQYLNKMIKGALLADLITLIGTVDIVFGEIDK